MKNKKIIALVLLAIMLFTVAGCGNPADNQTAEPTVTAAPTVTPTPTMTSTPTPTPTSTPTPTPTEKVIKMEEYVYIDKATGGVTEYSIDVTKMKKCGANTNYQVTAVYEDGSYTQEIVKADENGKVNLKFDKKATAIELSVVYKFSVGKDKTGLEEDGYAKVAITDYIDETKDYGFDGLVVSHNKGANLMSTKASFVVNLPDGMYDVTVTKADDDRATLYMNGGAFGINVSIGGKTRKGPTDRVYIAKDIVIEGGEARFSMSNTYAFAKIEFARASELIPRKTHIYIGGDSTVDSYYPRYPETEPEAGTAQTGWGQLFEYYVTDDVIVDGMGAGGTYAKSWYDLCFQGVINNAQAGDYFIIQEGINDRTYSNTTEMVEYLTKMIDQCVEKGVIPVLVTSQQTAKFWKSANGQEVGEYGRPEGSGLNPFMVAIRELAASKNVLFVDNAAMTTEWYSKVGKTYVEQTYHIYDAKTNTVTDSLHSSYAGSKKIAELIATDIARQIKEGAKDAQGNTFDGITLNPIVEYEFEYKDSTGAMVTTTISAVDYDNYK